MEKRTNIISRISYHIRSFKIGRSKYEYAITFGLLSSFLFFIKGLFSYIFLNEDRLFNPELYLYYLIGVAALFLLMIMIHARLFKQESKFTHLIISLYPILTILLCVSMCYLFKDSSNRTFSFFVLMIIMSWVQIYTSAKRILVFSIGLVSYNGLYALLSGFDQGFLNNFFLSGMTVLIAFISATIFYKIYNQQQHTIQKLDDIYHQTSDSMKELEVSNLKLKQSHNITASMLKITQEVLKNEKIEDVLQLVLDEAMNLIPHSQAGSILVLRENNVMEFIAAKGYSLEKLQRVSFTYEDLYQAHFDDPYEPTIIKNLETFDEAHLGEEKTKEIFSEGVSVAKSCLTCSFKFNDQFYGSINIDNFDSEDIYTDHDIYLMKQLSTELEIIISIHDLYEKAIRPTKIDELTQANTRTHCMKLLNDVMEDDQIKRIAVCTMDVNHLKVINDQFGHDVGDKYLIAFADGIRKSPIEENIFGRIGGDEFLLIFKDLSYKEALAQIETIHRFMHINPFKTEGYEGVISFATGVAVYPDDGEKMIEILKISDKRMYDDKRDQIKT